MSDFDWRTALNKGRSSASNAVEAASDGARDVAANTRQRVSATYDSARDRAAALADASRTLSVQGRKLGVRAAGRGKQVVDGVLVESRGLIADRPVTAVVIGIAAGVILGFLANRLSKPQPVDPDDDENAEYGG